MQPFPLLRQPSADPRYYQTFTTRAPLRTHWRSATCEEIDCTDFLNGFVLTVDVSTDLGKKQFAFVQQDKKRSCTMQSVSMSVRKFVYQPGNICFRYMEHRVPNWRDPELLVVGGDWRGNPSGSIVRHTRVEHWVEQFADNQIRLAELQKRG